MDKKHSIELDYSPLWIMLMKYKVSKNELSRRSGINIKTIERMTNNLPVHLSVLMKICRCFECKISDIVRIKRKDFSFPTVDTVNMRLSYAGINRLLEKYDISMNELGQRTGLGSKSLKTIKMGEPIHLSAVLRICECFECEIEDIVEVVDNDET